MQTRAKLSSSLAWLSKFVDSDETRTVLHTPYIRHELRGEVIAVLNTPASYASVYHRIYPSEPLEISSFWPLIHGLARWGIYVLEGDETAVNDSMLKQKNPFRELAHLALLDGLMAAYVSSVVTTERVVKAVRNVSSFNPSKELPASTEGALLLWVQKVTEAVNEARHPEEPGTGPGVTALVPPRQRRHNRMGRAARAGGDIPKVTDIMSGIVDGQCLAALLLWYAPQGVEWKDFYFSTEPLPVEQCLHNHNQVRQFCNAHLTPLAFHMSPHHLVNFAPTGILKSNTDAMLAHLFWCLEIQGLGSQSQQHASVFSEVQKVRDEAIGTKKGKQTQPSQSVSFQQSRGSLVQPASSRLPLPLSSSSSSLGVDLYGSGTGAGVPPSSMVRSSLSAPQLEVAVANKQHVESRGKMSSNRRDLISASVERLEVMEQLQSSRNLQHPRQETDILAGGISTADTDLDVEEERLAYLSSTLKDVPLHEAPLNTPRSQHFLKQPPDSSNKTQGPEPHPPDQPSCLAKPEQLSQVHVFPKDCQSTLHQSQLNHIPDLSIACLRPPSKAEAASTTACRPESTTVKVKLHQTDTDVHPPHSEQNPGVELAGSQSKPTPGSGNDSCVRGSFTISRHHSHPSPPLADLPTAPTQTVCTQIETTTVASKQTPPSSECRHIRLLPSQSKPHPPEDPSCVPREVLKVREKLKRLKEDFLRSEALHQQQWCRQRRELYFHLVRATVQKGRHITQPGHVEAADPCRSVGDEDSGQGHEVEKKRAVDEGEGLVTLAEDPVDTSEGGVDLQHKVAEESDHSMEELMQRKVQQLRIKLEEREKVRRAVADERKRRHSAKRITQEFEKANWDAPENKLKMQSSSETEVCRAGSDILQYRLSSVSSEESHTLRSRSHPDFITHDGPQCYVQPQLKSNKKLIKNALCHICLAGEVNVSTKLRALAELESHQATHFLILFRDTLGFKFKALYYLVSDEGHIIKVFGNGPHTVSSSQISNLYKYNSGAKQFKEVPSKSFSLSVDALTIKNEFWHSRKARPPF